MLHILIMVFWRILLCSCNVTKEGDRNKRVVASIKLIRSLQASPFTLYWYMNSNIKWPTNRFPNVCIYPQTFSCLNLKVSRIVWLSFPLLYSTCYTLMPGKKLFGCFLLPDKLCQTCKLSIIMGRLINDRDTRTK